MKWIGLSGLPPAVGRHGVGAERPGFHGTDRGGHLRSSGGGHVGGRP